MVPRVLGGPACAAALPCARACVAVCRYVQVTVQWYRSRGQAPPTDDFIRGYYRKMKAQL